MQGKTNPILNPNVRQKKRPHNDIAQPQTHPFQGAQHPQAATPLAPRKATQHSQIAAPHSQIAAPHSQTAAPRNAAQHSQIAEPYVSSRNANREQRAPALDPMAVPKPGDVSRHPIDAEIFMSISKGIKHNHDQEAESRVRLNHLEKELSDLSHKK